MSRVRREPKYIGSAIRNDMEEGDELCIALDNGRYYNIEVSYVLDGESGHGDREVFCGDEERKHVGLVVETEEVEKDSGYGTRVEWDVWAYTLTDDPDSPLDRYDIEALCIMGDGVRGPDMTLEEVMEEAEGTDLDVDPSAITDLVEDLEEMQKELDYVMRQARKVEDNELTLAEYENRLSAFEVKQGGRLTLDGV